jgi:hypothetical protein
VLPASDEPMTPVSIHDALLAELDTPISKSTIKHELTAWRGSPWNSRRTTGATPSERRLVGVWHHGL